MTCDVFRLTKHLETFVKNRVQDRATSSIITLKNRSTSGTFVSFFTRSRSNLEFFFVQRVVESRLIEVVVHRPTSCTT